MLCCSYSIHSAEQRFKDEFDSECKKVEKLIQSFIEEKLPEYENTDDEKIDENQSVVPNKCTSVDVLNALPEVRF